ncbi:SGNH/GDSL hydrolase family protein [Sphingomonas sp. RS6]
MILRLLALAVALATPGDVPPLQSVSVGPVDTATRRVALPLHIGGRVAPAGAGFRHQWPGIYAEAAFRGPRVVLRFDDALNDFRVTIDDLPPIAIPRPGRHDVTIAGLADGDHRIRLDKVNESPQPALFGGMFVAPGHALPAPPARRRQIEFIGDSSMTGYGTRSAERVCTPQQVRDTTDTPDAFAAIAARHFDADYQVNAVSGRGLVRNYSGTAPDGTMLRLASRRFPAEATPYVDRAWRPQIVMLKLQADFVGFRPDARWPDMAAVAAGYVDGHRRLFAELHARAPDAVVILWWFDAAAMPPAQVTAIREMEVGIAAAAREAGLRDLLFLPFSTTGYAQNGCHSHFGLAEQRRVADWLIAAIDTHPGFWNGR